jgi:hypothetical protein
MILKLYLSRAWVVRTVSLRHFPLPPTGSLWDIISHIYSALCPSKCHCFLTTFHLTLLSLPVVRLQQSFLAITVSGNDPLTANTLYIVPQTPIRGSPWRWRYYILLNHSYELTRPHSVISKKVLNAVRVSNLNWLTILKCVDSKSSFAHCITWHSLIYQSPEMKNFTDIAAMFHYITMGKELLISYFNNSWL